MTGARAETDWPTGRPKRTAHPLAAPPRKVGALLFHNSAGNHFCTASVVDSPHHDLIVTAAHCVYTRAGHYQQDIVFAPGYHQGQAPYGIWRPTAIILDQRWISSFDPDVDVAFLVLGPEDGKEIGDVLTGNHLAVGQPDPVRVRVTGYPNTANSPITCTARAVSHSPTQQRFACGGYATGTSGSPWVTDYDAQTHVGELVGVIGGYQQGGDTPDVSYSPRFGAAIASLYAQAVAAGAA